ncbi:MAG: prepilin-type N-terminal cleavage/methylation domain-containing protein [Tissierellales bacterium]|nr:prepilin-type N-terminal cleavage/methylation domain-containing protein [Tissierellales bacterium]
MNARDLSNDGFTLIELIISISIISVIIVGIYNIIFISTKSMNLVDEKDEYLVSGIYVIEYISDEIRSADLILPSSMIKNLDKMYPYNLKFVILNINEGNYDYVTYYYTGKEIVRLNCKLSNANLPEISNFNGYNKLDIGISNIWNTGLELNNNMIYLDFTFEGTHSLRIKSGINIENKIIK